MVRLLYDLALRRGEVVRIDLADVDVAGRRLWVLGKGRREKAPLTLPDATLAAIMSWIAARGGEAGPLFTHLDITGKARRTGGWPVRVCGRWSRRLAERLASRSARTGCVTPGSRAAST
jgi:integrase